MGLDNRHRRLRPLTRDDLINRLARATGLTWPEAHDAATEYDSLERLREIVEAAEDGKYDGQRRSFARSQPTTTIQGQTR